MSIKTIDHSSPMLHNIETIDCSLTQDPACASLLPKAEVDVRYNNNLFGQFKGFTITPIQNHAKLAEPTKAAPPPPTVPTVAIKTNIKATREKTSTIRNQQMSGSSKTLDEDNNTSAPKLPPMNPGSTARPLISSPVLAATTCTSVELVPSKVPTRPAPEVPTRTAPPPPVSFAIPKPQRPNSTPLTNLVVEGDQKKVEKGSTLNRLASMLRPSNVTRSNSQPAQKDEKNMNSLPRNQHLKANKVIDKEILRNLEISNPIPQKEIEIQTPVIPVVSESETEKKNVVMRAQSMRDPKVTVRPAIHTFGSMRQTTPVKRPTSIPASIRPTSPPPGPPTGVSTSEKENSNDIKIPGLPGYQNPPVKTQQQLPAAKPIDDVYDDCMNLVSAPSLTKIMEESPSNDNIYAVIEESVPEKTKKNIETQQQDVDNEYKSPKRVEPAANLSAGGLDTMGLLSEIVSEISNRNFDSIYSTSTLARKKKEKEENAKAIENLGSNSSLGGYMNSSHYKSPGSVYSNSPSGKFNSSSSTTSSGYLNPNVVNVPQTDKDRTLKNASGDKDTCLARRDNVSEEMSKELGMSTVQKPFVTTVDRPTPILSISTRIAEKKEESKNVPSKPQFNRTKTPPNLSKTSTARTTKQNSEANPKSPVQSPEGAGSSIRQAFDKTTTKARHQAVSNKSTGNPTKANSSLDKLESHNTNLNASSVKSVPFNAKDDSGKLNSPDLVSSCSNSNQTGTKSPDVLGNNAKFGLSSKTHNVGATKSVSLSRGTKAPAMPMKPLSIVSKAASLSEKKKSPSTNINVVKSFSSAGRDNVSKVTSPTTKLPPKVEAKSNGDSNSINPVQRAANSKSNVASLQQKFEANKNSSATRVLNNNNKKAAGKVSDLVVGKK
ncbi:hypothetical protein KPH14_009692 [Odynerus spinipes]|uniref:Uncharacterized protein n=1 Tax=Odynerus spinipes TaxID=1348599 RepID=A0AAD9RR49_9HYME|nr:hypothetical protein KPH14_009692 [Odynerus spinipes]